MKLTHRLNFTNIFTLSFYARRSQKRKKTDNLTLFFTFLGSTCMKAVRRALMKFSPSFLTACCRTKFVKFSLISKLFVEIYVFRTYCPPHSNLLLNCLPVGLFNYFIIIRTYFFNLELVLRFFGLVTLPRQELKRFIAIVHQVF
jgi:hypothetical protein